MADDDETSLELPADLSAPARARQALALLVDDEPRLRDRLALLTTELVTNSLRHGGLEPDDRIELRARREDGRVRVEVHDPGRSGGAPQLRVDPRSKEGAGGLGLRLVEQVAESWGAERVPGDGVRAWFVVAA